MRRYIASLLALGFLAATFTVNSVAADKDKDKDKKKKEAPELSPELKLLKELTGNFDAKIKFYKDKEPVDMTGTMSRKMVLESTISRKTSRASSSTRISPAWA